MLIEILATNIHLHLLFICLIVWQFVIHIAIAITYIFHTRVKCLH